MDFSSRPKAGAGSAAGIDRTAARQLCRLAVAALALTTPDLGSASDPSRSTVVISSNAQEPLLDQTLMEAVSTELAELGVRLVRSAEPSGSARAADRDVLAFVWVEHTPDATVVHFYEPAGRSLRERRIPVANQGAASAEEVAIVVRSAVNALLDRERSTAAAPPLPSRPSSPAPVSPTPRRGSTGSPAATVLLELSLGYSGTVYAPELAWQNGATLSLASGRWSHWRFGADFGWVQPSRRRTDQVELALQRYPFELFVGYDVPLANRWLSLRPEGALGVDVLGRRTDRVQPSFEQTPAATRVTWEASSRLRLTVQPAPRWGLYALVGADFLLNRVEQVIGSETLVTPLRTRPRLELGLALGVP